MQALRLYGANDLRLDDLPIPEVPAGGLLVKVSGCSICGSDLRNIRAGGSSHGMTLPVTLGHELSGVIDKVSDGVTEYTVGQRVVLSALVPCGTCEYCLRGMQNMCNHKEALSYQYAGGFAEYIAVPEAIIRAGGVIPLPDSVSLIEAAITEPCSCALNGQELSNVGLGDVVCVMGAGPLGVAHCMIAKLRGASKVILVDIVQERIDMAKEFPQVDVRINGSQEDVVQRVMEETGGRGADVVIVASPASSAQVQGVQMAAKHGRVNFFGGLPKGNSMTAIDSNIVHYRELFLHGTSDSTAMHMRAILDLIADGRLNTAKLVTHVMPLSEFKAAFDLAASGKALKVVLEPGK